MSPQRRQERLRSDEALAAKIAVLEHFDGMAGLRNMLRQMAGERGDWCGIPMPIEGTPLVIEPKYPNARELMEIGQDPSPEETGASPFKLRTSFYSHAKRCDVAVFEENGRVHAALSPAVRGLAHALGTLGVSDAWGIEQEGAAVQTLGTLVRHRQMKQYLMTGMFMERSTRSGIHYIFRRLRPTVALRERGESFRIMCTLCLHPIGYYAGSWAGAMTPTDDVVAHLTLMRGDEPMFWRRSNQHAPHRPEAGL
jgi:hypothetical protein